MSNLFNDIMSSLNELIEHAEGNPTDVVIHRRKAPTSDQDNEPLQRQIAKPKSAE